MLSDGEEPSVDEPDDPLSELLPEDESVPELSDPELSEPLEAGALESLLPLVLASGDAAEGSLEDEDAEGSEGADVDGSLSDEDVDEPELSPDDDDEVESDGVAADGSVELGDVAPSAAAGAAVAGPNSLVRSDRIRSSTFLTASSALSLAARAPSKSFSVTVNLLAVSDSDVSSVLILDFSSVAVLSAAVSFSVKSLTAANALSRATSTLSSWRTASLRVAIIHPATPREKAARISKSVLFSDSDIAIFSSRADGPLLERRVAFLRQPLG